MAGGGRGSRRRGRIRRRRGGSKLGGHGGGTDDIAVKPDSRNCEEWICVRGQCIRRQGRMRVDANGNVYVPDSEDEESDMEVEMQAGGVPVAHSRGPSVAADGMRMAVIGVPADGIMVGANGVTGDCVDVATKGVPADAVEVVGTRGTIDATKVAVDMATSEEMHPEVAARLNTLLAGMDPTFHDVFVSMYKVMVPAFFNP